MSEGGNRPGAKPFCVLYAGGLCTVCRWWCGWSDLHRGTTSIGVAAAAATAVAASAAEAAAAEAAEAVVAVCVVGAVVVVVVLFWFLVVLLLSVLGSAVEVVVWRLLWYCL